MKKERLGRNVRIYVMYAITVIALAALALLIYHWQLWMPENIKTLDPLNIIVLSSIFLVLLSSVLCCSITMGYRRNLKKFHRALFDAQTKPKSIEIKSRLKELTTIASDLNKVLDVWDKQFKLKEKDLKKDLDVEKQKLSEIWENLSDGVILTDTRFNVAFANKAIKETLGDTAEEIRCFEYLENIEKPCELCPLQEALNSGKPQKIIKQLRDVNGQKHFFECAGTVLTDQNANPIGGLILLKDVTRWMEMDTLIEDQSKELEETKAKLFDALEKINAAETKLKETDKFVSLGLLASEIVHEITNPINFIQAGAQSIAGNVQKLLNLFDAYSKVPLMPRARAEIDQLEQSLDTQNVVNELSQFTQNAVQSAERVKELVQSLRSFIRPSYEIKEVDLHESIEGALVILNNQYRDRIQVLKYFNEIPKVMGNPNKLIQLFTNLLHNSIQAIDGTGEIAIATKRMDDRVVVEITDTGKGIPPDALPKIFDPFFTTKDAKASLGLGLAIVKTIVNEHGGNISVQSQLGKGTKFTIDFPAIA